MRKNSVRLLSLLLSAMLAGGALASCNKRETPTPEPKTEGTEVTEASKAPSQTTERPEEPTKGPEETTKKPEEPTKKPEETTKKPEEPEKPATEGLLYDLLADGTYKVVGLQSEGLTEVVIPSTYNGKAVSSIGSSAFEEYDSMKSIVIPNSVTSIGDDAFSWCAGLTSIVLPDSVVTIGGGAFEGCTGLTSITIPKRVTSIEDYAFHGCMGLTSVTIPEGVTSIGEEAFSECTGLTSITLPNSLISIGEEAFLACTGLSSVTIPDSVTDIDDGAFWDCTGLMSVTIGSGVTSIGAEAFDMCYKLVEVYNKSTLYISVRNKDDEDYGYGDIERYVKAVYTEPYTSKVSVDQNGYILYKDGNFVSLLGYTGNETDLTLPSGITEINQYAFYRCTGLTSIILLDGLTSIGEDAINSERDFRKTQNNIENSLQMIA